MENRKPVIEGCIRNQNPNAERMKRIDHRGTEDTQEEPGEMWVNNYA